MTDNITLPREVGEHLMWILEECPMHGDWCERDVVALVALREALAAPKQEPVMMAKDWLKITLRINRGDRVFTVERFLHLSEIKQSRFPLVQETADTAWQELNAAMEDKR